MAPRASPSRGRGPPRGPRSGAPVKSGTLLLATLKAPLSLCSVDDTVRGRTGEIPTEGRVIGTLTPTILCSITLVLVRLIPLPPWAPLPSASLAPPVTLRAYLHLAVRVVLGPRCAARAPWTSWTRRAAMRPRAKRGVDTRLHMIQGRMRPTRVVSWTLKLAATTGHCRQLAPGPPPTPNHADRRPRQVVDISGEANGMPG